MVAAGEPRDEYLRLDGIRVLVVDDNREAVHMASRVLGARGAEVMTVFSASEAIRALDQSEFDVLVSDIEMPGEDGYSLIRRIRDRTDAARYLPAVALTAYARVEDRTRALLEGFNSHLAKPAHPAELAAIVARAATVRVRPK
jgi:CheY-like chemotaxis protein